MYPINNFDPTYENIAKPDEVLVVYRDTTSSVSDTMSLYIKNYYMSKRNIPEVNSYGLTLPFEDIIDGHRIRLWLNGEVIKDFDWQDNTNHAWQYFINHIFNPIQNYLNTTVVNGQYLKDKIKYILICKGVPLKINPYYEDSRIGDYFRKVISFDGLLCFLNQTNSNFSLLNNLWGTDYSSIPNPYFYADKNLDGNYRFTSRHFSYTNYEINYLVSRLDGLTYSHVIDLIDKESNPDISGNNLFLLDAHFTSDDGVYALRRDAIASKTLLDRINYNSILDLTDYIYYDTPTPVIGYTSSGTHAGMPYYYNYLFTFDKPNGAIYNTYESFNGYYMDTLNLLNRNENSQGLLTEWLGVGGSGGAGHTYEPLTSTISMDSIFFPLYAIGYSKVDAAYQGMPYLAFRNVVVGDPLTTIAWGKQTLTSNLNWSGTNLVTGEVMMPAGRVLNIANNSTINLRHQGFITGDGELVVGQNVVFNIYSWQKGVFLSYDGDSPRLVWGSHPTLGPVVYYKAYRKVGTGSWATIATTTSLQYTDTQILFDEYGDGEPNIFYKVLAYTQLPTTYESNTVSCLGYKNPRKIVVQQNQATPIEYSLNQNYPNPFNPTTLINYSVKENGLVTLKVYDILGKEVANLVNENKEAGNYSVNFDAPQLPSGVYIYSIQAGEFVSSKKMILIK